MRAIRIFVPVLIAAGICSLCFAAGDTAPVRSGDMEEPSGLSASFPANAPCTEISSPYGSTTRYDGSPRPSFRLNGRHGGIDLSLQDGTPLRAVANGTVVTAGKGDQMEGFYLWLRHPPEATGLPYWVYSKYQHLRARPELTAGAPVTVGQVIAYSGRTGTTGGHYGVSGYSHLHLSTLKSPVAEYEIKGSLVQAPGSILMDPLSFYRDVGLSTTHPAGSKTVTIPYVSADGRIVPQGARVVWPVACPSR